MGKGKGLVNIMATGRAQIKLEKNEEKKKRSQSE